MSAPSPPPDNSYQIEMSRQQAAKEAQAAADAKELAHKQELTGLRSSSREAATGDVGNYFSERGIDPSRYTGSIASQLNSMLAGISPTDENPGNTFRDAGATIYDRLQTGERTKASDALNKIFPSDFQYSRVASTLDDPYLAAIEAEQFADADSIIKNMLDRGVLTSAGYGAAYKDLENQKAGVHAKVNDIGTGLLAGEQSALGGIANKARQSAGQLTLGQEFDPYKYSTEADTSFNEFLSGLSGNIKAGLPGKLFNTTGMAAIGGAAQGAGNTAFNPQAAGGTIDPSDDDASKDSIFAGGNKAF